MEKEPLINIELIEAFYEGNLDEDGRARVHYLLKTDSGFREEFELYHTLIAGIKDRHIGVIRKQLHKVDQELDNSSERKPNARKVRKLFGLPLPIAATFAFFLLAGSITMFYYSRYSKGAILAQYYIEDPGLPVYMGDGSSKDFDEAMNMYKLERYNESFSALKILLTTDPLNDTLLFYSGVNLFKLDMPASAINYFGQVVKITTSEFSIAAQYHQIICLWLMGKDLDADKQFLQFELINGGNEYRESLYKILKNK